MLGRSDLRRYFNLVPSSKKKEPNHCSSTFYFSLKCWWWIGSLFWEWDQVENTFRDFPTFKYEADAFSISRCIQVFQTTYYKILSRQTSFLFSNLQVIQKSIISNQWATHHIFSRISNPKFQNLTIRFFCCNKQQINHLK